MVSALASGLKDPGSNPGLDQQYGGSRIKSRFRPCKFLCESYVWPRSRRYIFMHLKSDIAIYYYYYYYSSNCILAPLVHQLKYR